MVVNFKDLGWGGWRFLGSPGEHLNVQFAESECDYCSQVFLGKAY